MTALNRTNVFDKIQSICREFRKRLKEGQPVRIEECILLLRELGRGGFGVVYEARHLQRGDHVALKTLPMIQDAKGESAQDAERLHRFRKEFRSLAEINHPNLAGMQTLEVEGAQWFITMDYSISIPRQRDSHAVAFTKQWRHAILGSNSLRRSETFHGR